MFVTSQLFGMCITVVLMNTISLYLRISPYISLYLDVRHLAAHRHVHHEYLPVVLMNISLHLRASPCISLHLAIPRWSS